MRAEIKEAPFPATSPRAGKHPSKRGTPLMMWVAQTERYTESVRFEETHDDGLLNDCG